MISSFWLVFLPFVYCGKLTPEENARLAKTCGPTYRREVSKSYNPDAEQLMGNEYPWTVKISPLNSDFFCSGSFISPRHVLTAAHCVIASSEKQVLKAKCPERKLRRLSQFDLDLGGKKCIHTDKCNQETKKKKAFKAYYHEEYDDCTVENDIAIIELDENVSEFDAIPICMPTRNQAINTYLTAVGAGWRGPNESDPSLAPIGQQKLTVKFVREQNKVILVHPPQRAGICGGDSGGALIQANTENKNLVLGVYSAGRSCKNHFHNMKIPNLPEDNDNAFDKFTDVRKYLGWICEKTGICQENDFGQAGFKKPSPSEVPYR